MGWQVLKQPNGLYCIFSTVVDNVIYYDGTKEQVINVFVQAERDRVARSLNEIFEALDEDGGKPYFQFTMSIDKMIETIRTHHGDLEAEKVTKLIKP